MEDFQWESPEQVGVARLDEQHLQLHRLATGLIGDLEADPADPGAEARFVELFHFTVEHFKTEEDYLEAQGYPGLVPHRFEHELLLDWTRETLARRGVATAPPLLEAARQFAEIIRHHQEVEDRTYATWLKDR
jgi:hemerythrin-like metal-binding protein